MTENGKLKDESPVALRIDCLFSSSDDLSWIELVPLGCEKIRLETKGSDQRRIRWREPAFAMAIYLIEARMWELSNGGSIAGYLMRGPLWKAPVSKLGEQWAGKGWIEGAFKPHAETIFPDRGNRNGRPDGGSVKNWEKQHNRRFEEPRSIGFERGRAPSIRISIRQETKGLNSVPELNRLRLAIHAKGRGDGKLKWSMENFGWSEDWNEQMEAIRAGFPESGTTAPSKPPKLKRDCYPLREITTTNPFVRAEGQTFGSSLLPADVHIREFRGSISRLNFYARHKLESRFRVVKASVRLLAENGMPDRVREARFMATELISGSVQAHHFALAREILDWAFRGGVLSAKERRWLRLFSWATRCRLIRIKFVRSWFERASALVQCADSTIGRVALSEPAIAAS
jgi:hypothetical protein